MSDMASGLSGCSLSFGILVPALLCAPLARRPRLSLRIAAREVLPPLDNDVAVNRVELHEKPSPASLFFVPATRQARS